MKSLFRGVIYCAMAALFVSCTVKEDRTVCPCLLEVHFTDREHIKDPVGLLCLSESLVFKEAIRTADYPEAYVRKVSKSMLSFAAVEGIDKCRWEGGSVVVPAGSECDSLYSFNDLIDCMGEKASTVVEFHKQFATVNIVISNADAVAQDYSFVVESSSNGIDILTAGAVPGPFRFEPELFENSRVRFRLPRQADDSLTLTVIHSSGDNTTFPLGIFISSIGYDWNAIDLQDIYITLDISRSRVIIGVAEWESSSEFELTNVEM